MFYKGKPSAPSRIFTSILGFINEYFVRRNGSTPMSGALTIDTNDTAALLVEQDGVEDNVLVVNTTTGRVGVGKAPTSGQLHVYHATDNTVVRIESGDANVALDFKDNSATGTIQWSGSNVWFKFQDAVVVETGSDASQINFTNAASEGGYLTSTAAGDAIISGGMDFDGTDWYARNANAGAYQTFNGAHYWYGNTGETPDATMTPTQLMELSAAGVFQVGAATNYTQIAANGDQSFAGTAGFYPRTVTQAAAPAAGTGATQCDTGELIVWEDSDNTETWLVYNRGGTVKGIKVENI